MKGEPAPWTERRIEERDMALRPLAFGVRLRDRGRTLRVHNDPRDCRRYVLEDAREGEPTRIRHYASAPEAVREAAATWRRRLH
jgi:hypothetical protein